MDQFELFQSQSHRDSLASISRPPSPFDSLLRDVWSTPRKPQTTSDATSRYKAQVDDRGVPILFQDDTVTWESTDGKTWKRKGSNGMDYFNGTVTISGAGTISITNHDTGVKLECKKDGTTTRSITTASGTNYSVTKNSTGRLVSCKTNGTEWSTSDDGKTWSDADGNVWNGTVSIDRFGQYKEQPAGGAESIKATSKEFAASLQKQEKLRTEFGIKFGQPGQSLRYSGVDYTLRSPSLQELETLENVLKRNKQMNFKNLTLVFVQSDKTTDGASLWGVYQRQDNAGRVITMPRHTEANGWNALEGTLEHEFVHHEQYENWGDQEWGARGSPEFTKELNNKMGWRFDTTTNRYYMFDRDGKEWQRVDGGWAPLVDGKPLRKRSISNIEMRKIAQVRPCTDYFTNPGEMHAEAMAMFRMDRAMLLRESPALYDICKQWDQDLITEKLGKKPDGKPRYMRNAQGRIVDYTADNLNALKKTEERWRRENESRPLRVGDRLFVHDAQERGREGGCAHCRTPRSESAVSTGTSCEGF